MPNVDQYAKMPAYVRAKLDDYAKTGIGVGGFLTAVLENNLFEAVNRADEDNLVALTDIVQYIWNRLPAGCWGSPKKVQAWQESFDARSASERKG